MPGTVERLTAEALVSKLTAVDALAHFAQATPYVVNVAAGAITCPAAPVSARLDFVVRSTQARALPEAAPVDAVAAVLYGEP